MVTNNREDESAIQALIDSQFASLKWSSTQAADWLTFEAGFIPEAQLFPAARPTKALSVRSFRTRMETLRTDGTLASFLETSGPTKIWVIGQVAVAIASCEMLENERTVRQDVSVFLLVKNEGIWRIAAQGWDIVKDFQPIAL